MKKIVCFLTVLVLSLSIVSAVSANEYDEVQIIAYDYGVNFENKPILINDRTLVDLKAFSEFLVKDGAIEENAVIDDATGKITIGSIELVLESTAAKVNEEEAVVDVAATTIGETVYIPLRFVCENLGYTVEWRGFGYLGEGGFVMISAEK